MKVFAVLALAIATLTVASPAAEPELAKRSCQSDCASIAERRCDDLCKNSTSPSCEVACYDSVYKQCLNDYC